MERIIELLDRIKNETQEINHNFIYDFLAKNKEDVSRNDFLTNSLKKISNDYEYGENEILTGDPSEILRNKKYSENISFGDFVDYLIKTIPVGYKNELITAFDDFVSRAEIYKFDYDIVELIYPYFDNIFFIETQNNYIVFSLGYVD
jgi:hypothetical protein